MPVILPPADYDLWLDPGFRDLAATTEMLRPFDAELMRPYPVSARVNRVDNDDPQCSESIQTLQAARIGRTKEDNGRVRWLSEDEEAKLRAAIKRESPDHVPAFDLSVHTGMGSGEQFSLQWSQVDWERRIVILPRTKNGTSRHVPLNAVALRALRQLKRRHDKIKPDSPWVHLNRDKDKLRGHRDWFEPALKSSGLVEYSWHCNRHTFASRLVMAGVDLRTVGELLGHRTPSMTWRYSHLAPAPAAGG